MYRIGVRPGLLAGLATSLLLSAAGPGHGAAPPVPVVGVPLGGGGAYGDGTYLYGEVGTPVSAEITAQAKYIQAQGEFLESLTRARETNARAVEDELKNWTTYVDDYFKRRELNRQWREKEEHYNYAENEEKRQGMMKRRMEKGFQDMLRGDLTDRLNWLLHEMAGPTLAYQYLPQGQALVNSKLDIKLAPRDLEQIWLTDGGKGMSRLVCRAADGKVLTVNHWPLAMQGREFDVPRARFEAARDKLLADLKQDPSHPVSRETQREVVLGLEQLFDTLDHVYTKEVRAEPAEFLQYNAATAYLKSLLAGVNRAMTTRDPSVFNGSLRFEGESLVGLIQHMYQNGASFAPCQAGGEGQYEKLFAAMRNLYLNVGSEKADAEFARTTGEKAPADVVR